MVGVLAVPQHGYYVQLVISQQNGKMIIVLGGMNECIHICE